MGKRKSHGPVRRTRGPRINEQITEEQVRVIIDGEGAEVMERNKALELATARGLDLVEISPDQKPPVCKIIDFGKWKYEQQKKKREQSKNQHVIQIKEIKMRPKIGTHDYEIKMDRAIGFLEKGNKVKASLRFRGREMAHPELGMKLMHKLAEDVSGVAVVETPPKMEGRQIVMILGAKAKRKKESTPADKKGLDTEPGSGDEVDSGS